MIKGLYSAGSGLVSQVYRQQIISHNLANVNTTGFKADRLGLDSFPGLASADPVLLPVRLGDVPAGDSELIGAGVMALDRPFDLSQGGLRPTGVELDFALEGPGFFAVQTENGIVYTRNGAFHRSPEGVLVDAEGYPVLGQAGPIQVGADPVAVTPEGIVIQDGQEVGRLRLVDFPADQLLKLGENHFAPVDPAAQGTPATATVLQGHLETSNVDLVQMMTEMLSAMRSYEASQRLVLYQDQILGQTVTEVGRVG